MAAIHFVERLGNFSLRDAEANEWESGFWVVSAKSAEKLVGADIYLHRGQNEPSFCGGVITGYRFTQANNDGRVIFSFIRSRTHEGVMALRSGWGNEQMRVWD